MTIIVYRDGIMAADSLEHYDHLKVKTSCQKVWRMKSGALFGGCGNSSSIDAVKNWINRGKRGPRPMTDETFAAILAVSPTEIYDIGQSLNFYQSKIVRGSLFAVCGCAERYAIGMLIAGLSATETVKILVECDPRLGGPVQFMRL